MSKPKSQQKLDLKPNIKLHLLTFILKNKVWMNFLQNEQNEELDRILQRFNHFSTIFAGVIAILAFMFSCSTFQVNSNSQNEANSLAILQNYFELAIDNPKFVYPKRSYKLPENSDNFTEEDWKYLMFASNTIFTAETLYKLQKYDPAWKETVKDLVEDHLSFAKSRHFECKQYSYDFIRFLKEDLDNEICLQINEN